MCPSLFWFETRNLFLMAERRGRLKPGEAVLSMAQLRLFPLSDEGSGTIDWFWLSPSAMASPAMTPAISLWPRPKNCRLATFDKKLVAAARAENVPVLGPLGGP